MRQIHTRQKNIFFILLLLFLLAYAGSAVADDVYISSDMKLFTTSGTTITGDLTIDKQDAGLWTGATLMNGVSLQVDGTTSVSTSLPTSGVTGIALGSSGILALNDLNVTGKDVTGVGASTSGTITANNIAALNSATGIYISALNSTVAINVAGDVSASSGASGLSIKGGSATVWGTVSADGTMTTYGAEIGENATASFNNIEATNRATGVQTNGTVTVSGDVTAGSGATGIDIQGGTSTMIAGTTIRATGAARGVLITGSATLAGSADVTADGGSSVGVYVDNARGTATVNNVTATGSASGVTNSGGTVTVAGDVSASGGAKGLTLNIGGSTTVLGTVSADGASSIGAMMGANTAGMTASFNNIEATNGGVGVQAEGTVGVSGSISSDGTVSTGLKIMSGTTTTGGGAIGATGGGTGVSVADGAQLAGGSSVTASDTFSKGVEVLSGGTAGLGNVTATLGATGVVTSGTTAIAGEVSADGRSVSGASTGLFVSGGTTTMTGTGAISATNGATGVVVGDINSQLTPAVFRSSADVTASSSDSTSVSTGARVEGNGTASFNNVAATEEAIGVKTSGKVTISGDVSAATRATGITVNNDGDLTVLGTVSAVGTYPDDQTLRNTFGVTMTSTSAGASFNDIEAERGGWGVIAMGAVGISGDVTATGFGSLGVRVNGAGSTTTMETGTTITADLFGATGVEVIDGGVLLAGGTDLVATGFGGGASGDWGDYSGALEVGTGSAATVNNVTASSGAWGILSSGTTTVLGDVSAALGAYGVVVASADGDTVVRGTVSADGNGSTYGAFNSIGLFIVQPADGTTTSVYGDIEATNSAIGAVTDGTVSIAGNVLADGSDQSVSSLGLRVEGGATTLGGTLTANDGAVGALGKGGVLTVGDTVTATGGSLAIYASDDGTINLGGDLSASGASIAARAEGGNAVVNIKDTSGGGIANVTATDDSYAFLVEDGGTVNLDRVDADALNLLRTGSGGRMTAANSVLDGEIYHEGAAAGVLAASFDNSAWTGTANTAGAGAIDLAFAGGSVWNVAGDSLTGGALAVDASSAVDFRSSALGTKVTVDTLSGGGNFVMKTDIVSGSGDRLVVSGSSSGSHLITVANSGSDATDGTERLILVETADQISAFALTNNVELGAWTYLLRSNSDGEGQFDNANGQYWELYNGGSKPDASNPGSAAINTFVAGYLLNYAETNTLIQRLGDLRNETLGGQSGVWFRAYGGKFKDYAREYVKDFDMSYGGVQVGYDRKWENDWLPEGENYYGVFAGFGKADLDFIHNGGGSGGAENRTFGLYATHVGGSGFYVDAIAKYVWSELDFDVLDSAGTLVTGDDVNSGGLGLSLEAGKRIPLGVERENKGRWYIEPQVQLSWQHMKGGTFRASNGLQIGLDSYDSLLGRAGFLLGYQTARTNFYAKVSYVKEFQGDLDIHANGERIFETMDDDWIVYGIGLTHRLNPHNALYLDFERASEGKFTQDWAIKGGWRISF